GIGAPLDRTRRARLLQVAIVMAQPFDDPTLPRRYRGKTVLVTGAASGVGRATALRVAAEGAQVWCVDLNGDGAAETARHITHHPGAARAGALDVRDAGACAQVIAGVVATLGGLDVLCNVAGVGGSAHTVDETPENFMQVMSVNAAGPFYLSHA